MRYLIDESVTMKKCHRKDKAMELSDYKLGAGAKDREVLEYAIKKKLALVTNDMKLAMQTALRNHPVFYLSKNNRGFIVKLEQADEIVKFSGSMTFYLLENDKIVIP